MDIIQNMGIIDAETSSTSPVEVFDQATDDNGKIKFVRRGSSTGAETKNIITGE